MSRLYLGTLTLIMISYCSVNWAFYSSRLLLLFTPPHFSLFLSEQTVSNSTHTPFYLSLQTHSLSLQTLYIWLSLYSQTPSISFSLSIHTLSLSLYIHTLYLFFSLHTLSLYPSFSLHTSTLSFYTMSRIVLTF